MTYDELTEKKKHLLTALTDKTVEAYYKSLAEEFWLRRSDKLQGKQADDARTTASAANHEKHVAEEWVSFLKEKVAALEKEISKLQN